MKFRRLADAHCHADFSEYADFSGLAFGLDLCVDACFPGDWEGLKKFDAFPIKKAYGIHPDLRISEFEDIAFVESEIFGAFLPKLSEYIESADAVGETGLDRNLERRVPMYLQKRLFDAQLELAGKFGLPAIIHCAGEWGAVFDTLKAWTEKYGTAAGERRDRKKTGRFLLHAAKCSREMVEIFESMGGYFSFGLRELGCARGAECARAASAGRVMVESDSESSKAKIEDTVSKLAEIRNVEADEMSETVFANFTEFYSK